MKSTSINSYRQHVIEGKARTQREKIYDALIESPTPLTRRQIANVTRIEINAVCGRVNALVDSGIIIISHVSEDPITGKRVEFLSPRWPQPAQRRMSL